MIQGHLRLEPDSVPVDSRRLYVRSLDERQCRFRVWNRLSYYLLRHSTPEVRLLSHAAGNRISD